MKNEIRALVSAFVLVVAPTFAAAVTLATAVRASRLPTKGGKRNRRHALLPLRLHEPQLGEEIDLRSVRAATSRPGIRMSVSPRTSCRGVIVSCSREGAGRLD